MEEARFNCFRRAAATDPPLQPPPHARAAMRRGGAWLRLALVAAAVTAARAGGCSGARHALLPLQTANPHKYAHVACIHVVPGREATLHLLVPAANFTGGGRRAMIAAVDQS